VLNFLFRHLRLVFGLFLYAVGIVLTMQANVGYAPWDVFHAGLARVSGISFGMVSILVGLAIVVLSLALGEKLGFGTFCNMVLIGVFLDVLLQGHLIPRMDNAVAGYACLLAGLMVIAVGSYFYMGSGFGAGPRDSLMMALTRRTGLPVGLCRAIIELLAVGTGWLMGGLLGLGTVVAALGIGFCVQLVFRVLRFDPGLVRHETLAGTLASFRAAWNGRSA
jgi:uncharacterized membrane protein YczE